MLELLVILLSRYSLVFCDVLPRTDRGAEIFDKRMKKPFVIESEIPLNSAGKVCLSDLKKVLKKF